MAAQFTPFISTALLLALVAFSIKTRLLAHYPMFYTYVGAVIISDCIRFVFITYYRYYYLPIYWYTQFLSVAFGFGIIQEMYAAIFRDYPGTARMAKFLVSLALGVVLLNTLIQITITQSAGINNVISLEKNMRLVQAILLALGIALVMYYEIPLGTNASGILYGYGAFVIAGIVLLTLREQLGPEFYKWWASGQAFSYRATLGIWLLTLHSYRPAPVVVGSPEMAEDYFQLVRSTRTSLARIRSSLGKTIQP